MKQNEINKILYITAALMLTYVVIMVVLGFKIFSLEGIRKIWEIAPILVFLWYLYFSFGWKIQYLNKIIFRPNLNGTWLGKYTSRNTKSNEDYQGEICLVIKQSFLITKITSYTENYMSYSYAESLLHYEESDGTTLIYVYSQNQFNLTDNGARKGTTELQLIGTTKNYRLFGDFWTNKDTVGRLDVKRVDNKKVSSFQDAKAIYIKRNKE